MAHKYEIYKNKAGEFIVRFKYNSEVIFSSEGYSSKLSAQNLIDSLKKFAPGAPVEDSTGGTDLHGKANLQTLRSTIREQVPAPLKFDIINDQLVVDHQLAVPDLHDAASITSARLGLLSMGQTIIDELSGSNFDSRLVKSFKELQEKLSSASDIIQLGFLNRRCEKLTQAISQELPDTLAAMLLAQTTDINDYLGQFSEWSKFTDNASQLIDFNSEDTHAVQAVTEQVIQDLKDAKNVDPEVPRTLILLKELLTDPEKGSKRTIFAIVRTLENLVAKIFSYAADFFDQTVSETVKATAKTSGRVVTVFLFSIALNVASSIPPTASKIGNVDWIKQAAEIVTRQIEGLNKRAN